nr:MAG TPA: hypothetical protein [Caudoviricetes sp.]
MLLYCDEIKSKGIIYPYPYKRSIRRSTLDS